MNKYVVDFTWDDEAGVWVAECDAVPLVLESNSFDALIERVKIAMPEILELNNLPPTSEFLIHSERLIAANG